jgi:Cytochrome c7 and related cytochrome c/Class III cytochrome C family
MGQQLFPRSSNLIWRVIIVLSVPLTVAGFFAGYFIDRSPYVTYQNIPRVQPVPFSHKHHADQLGIDCRYCHTSVEKSSFAGLPATEICMTCHSEIWKNSAMLEPVRASYRDNKPIEWTRVNMLPEFVYFDHSIHVAKGIGCTTCHGPVGTMPLTWAGGELKMSWCLNCHRHPEDYVRPRNEVFNINYAPPANQKDMGKRLVKEYGIYSLTDCVTCHR